MAPLPPTKMNDLPPSESSFSSPTSGKPSYAHEPTSAHNDPWAPSATLDPARHPYLYKTASPKRVPQLKFPQLSKRTKIIIAVVTACIIALVIGLATGLSLRNKVQNLPLPSNNGGPYQGELTYYAPGLGACGIVSTDGENIVALSHLLFDAVSTSSNPNENPLCGKRIRARRSTGTVDLEVVDRCTGCQPRDLDITEKVFAKLAKVDEGRVDVEWSWLETVPERAG